MRKVFVLFTVLLITSACNKKLKETVGILTAGPNEYQVQRSKALEVPPHYYLPVPTNNQAVYNVYNNVNDQVNLNKGEQALIQEMK